MRLAVNILVWAFIFVSARCVGYDENRIQKVLSEGVQLFLLDEGYKIQIPL